MWLDLRMVSPLDGALVPNWTGVTQAPVVLPPMA